MSTITPTIDQSESDVIRVTWATMANGDIGSPVTYPQWADRSVQIIGTFGAGGTVVIQGTNDGTNYSTLADVSGTALSFTAAGFETIMDVPWKIRPNVTAGDGTTSLTVVMVMRHQSWR